MKPILTCLIFSAIIFPLTTFIWWLFFYSGLNIPEYIPHTQIKIYGLTLFSIDLLMLIIALKTIVKQDLTISVIRLTLWGTLIMFLFESVFHVVLSTTYDEDKVYHYFHGVIAMTLFGTVMSFLIAFQLKTKKTRMLVGLIIGVSILFRLIELYFPATIRN